MDFRRKLRELMNKLGYDLHRLPYPHVELHFWRPDDGSINFGDFLSPVIVDQCLRTHGFTMWDEAPCDPRLLALGSILQSAFDGDIVWGSGLNLRSGKDDERFAKVTRLDIRALRGPRTQEVMRRRGISVPDIFGDPALLLPSLFPGRFQRRSLRAWIFVPNLHDIKFVDQAAKNVVSPLGSWNRNIEAILEADLVLSSSLHGLVVAEAYGIPARYVRLSEAEGAFKYHDYYEGTGRFGIEFASSIVEGLEMGGAQPLQFDSKPLMNAFPVDLWRGKT